MPIFSSVEKNSLKQLKASTISVVNYMFVVGYIVSFGLSPFIMASNWSVLGYFVCVFCFVFFSKSN